MRPCLPFYPPGTSIYSPVIAFRHGDIEDVLSELAKKGGGMAAMFGAMKMGGKVCSVFFADIRSASTLTPCMQFSGLDGSSEALALCMAAAERRNGSLDQW